MNSNSVNLDAGEELPVAVIGCGRMGRHHARTYAQMPGVRLAGVFDANAQAAAAVAAEYGCAAFSDLDAALAGVRAVTIAVPTVAHAAVAQKCLSRSIACLIEKPLAPDVDECEKIVQWGRQAGVPVQVGHVERFNPAMRALEALKLTPRFIDASRISPMTFRSNDVGVVLDLMIHDIDLVLKLAGGKVERCDAVGVSVIGPIEPGAGAAEDICNARLTFDNGCVANLTASRLALHSERRMRVYSADAFVSIDYQKRSGVVVHRAGNLTAVREAAARVRAGEVADLTQVDYTKLVNLEPLQVDATDALRAQLDSFVDVVRTGKRPQVDATDGLAAVALARRIVECMATQEL